MLSFMISLLFAATLIGSTVAIALMLSRDWDKMVAALMGEPMLAHAGRDPTTLTRHVRVWRVDPSRAPRRAQLRAAA